MDKITQEDPQSVSDISSPLSPKRPRTDCISSGKKWFDIRGLLTFRKTAGFPSSTSTLHNNAGLICTAECEDMQDEKPHEQQQDAKLNVTPITKVSSSHTDNRHIGSSAERHFLHLEKDEQPSVTETDKLSSHPADDAGGVLAECHTPKDSCTDTSSRPDCQQLGKSLENEPPGGCSLSSGIDEEGRQVQNSVNQIQVVILSSSDEEVRCQSDYTYEDVLRDIVCKTRSQSAEAEEHNQKGDEHGFSENILFSKEEKEGKRHSDYGDSKSFCCNPEEEPSGNLTEGGKNYIKKSELQIQENENVAVCNVETKEQVNENGMSKNPIFSAAVSTEASVVSYDVTLARDIAIECASLEVDDFCETNEECAAGEMIGNARSETADHLTETPMPARISQELAEGDNDAGSLSVIDPAIWSESDRQAEEKRCNSESTAGVELSQSINVYEMETPLPLCSDVRSIQKISTSDRARQFHNQSSANTQQCKDEKEDLRQSYSEPRSYSITTNETHGMTSDEGSCRWESSPSSRPRSPAKPFPAGHERQESLGTVGHQLKEQDKSGCFFVSLDFPISQEVEYSQTGIVRMDESTEIKEREERRSFGEEVITNRLGNSGEEIELEEEPYQQNERTEDMNTISTLDNNITEWIEDEISTCGNKLAFSEDELVKTLECLSDHLYSADISLMEETVQVKQSVEGEMKTDGYSETSVKSEGDVLHENEHRADMAEISPDDCISDETEGNKLTPASEDEAGNELSYSEYQQKNETLTVNENKDDISGFGFPPMSDAVVPGPHDLSQTCHSKITDNYPTAPNHNDRFSPVPSAFTLYDCVPGAFDTFEKIQLSPDDEDDDDDDDAGPGNSSLLTSLPGQLLKKPQRQLYHSMPVAECDELNEIPEEEEEEELDRFECHTENMRNGFLNSDINCNELASFISAADVIALGWPEQQPNCESIYNHEDLNPPSVFSTVPSGRDSPACDVNEGPTFEMKKQFDMVLKELKLFFDISASDFAGDSRASSPEQCGDVTEASEGDICEDEHLGSPELGRHKDTSSNGADEDRSLETCGGDPVVSCIAGSHDGEQEVPFGGHLCQESSMYTEEKHRGS
ncbi:uncharacterized protein LOC122999612 [Scomber scombrus]|uniref:Uncharacterized protein LOC122999612 n=1 Tax=Scomber scombrus TaxID=13677 RepID=A0AAV1NYH5_SCOSC